MSPARKTSAEIESDIEQIAVSHALLETITEGFSTQRLVGEGAFAKVFVGSVYLAGNAAPKHLPGQMVVKVDKFLYPGLSATGEKLTKVKTPYMQKADKVLTICRSAPNVAWWSI